MVPDNQLEEFVRRMRAAAGQNLESVILFGSAVAGDFHPEFSNLNLFCVLRDSGFAALQALAPAVRWWNRQKQPLPLLMTRKELERSTDIFTIELLDMVQHHRVLFGEDTLQGLQIPLHLHRVQVEYELREKLLLFRQQLVLNAGDKRRLWSLLLCSAPSFVTLFRHALIALGHTAPAGKRAAVKALADQVEFEPSAIYQVLDLREHKIKAGKLDVNDLLLRYLVAIERVATAVDQTLEADTAARS